jgi:hypothetical protein
MGTSSGFGASKYSPRTGKGDVGSSEAAGAGKQIAIVIAAKIQ